MVTPRQPCPRNNGHCCTQWQIQCEKSHPLILKVLRELLSVCVNLARELLPFGILPTCRPGLSARLSQCWCISCHDPNAGVSRRLSQQFRLPASTRYLSLPCSPFWLAPWLPF